MDKCVPEGGAMKGLRRRCRLIRNNVIGVAVLVSTLTAATNSGATDLMPLASGNNWTYRDAVTGQSFTVRIGTPVFVNQNVYHTLRGYGTAQLLVRTNEYGNIVYWDEEKATDVLLISFERVPRAWWEAPGRECPQEGQTQEKDGVHNGPAGRWNAVEIRYRSFSCFDAGDELEQFAANIGMLRRVVNTIAGPRTFDLVYARIGTQVISAGNAGSFTVTASNSATPGFWTAKLRIDLPYGSGLNLSFPSSQEFDARLRDSAGNVVWTWSADKLFAAVFHERRIRGGLSVSFDVPHPPAIHEGSHYYTLEAWLTNSEGEPRFAAVTGVETPVTVPILQLVK
jgi:hypothetical protein